MGLWQRLTGRTPSPETRSASRYSDGYQVAALGAGYGVASSSGARVDPITAENLATVTACIGAISSAIASLPARVYQGIEADRTEVRNHPVCRLIRAPNEGQTWPDWAEWTLAQVLLHGNAVSAVDYDGAGRPVALRPLAWPACTPLIAPSGRLVLDFNDGHGAVRRYRADELFWLKDRTDNGPTIANGLIGRSRLSRAPEVLGNALSLQEFASATWRNQAVPSGVASHPGQLSREAFNNLREALNERYAGTQNARKTMLLQEGLTYQAISVSPEDAEVLASRIFSVEEICRLYAVPPPIVSAYEHNTFTNAETASKWFATLTLAPWCRKIEAEFQRSVFGAGDYSLEIDLSGLMRGSFTERWAAWQIAVASGVLDPAEIRVAEGWGPRPQNSFATAPAGAND
jgi:HK97 family phage portal protein